MVFPIFHLTKENRMSQIVTYDDGNALGSVMNAITSLQDGQDDSKRILEGLDFAMSTIMIKPEDIAGFILSCGTGSDVARDFIDKCREIATTGKEISLTELLLMIAEVRTRLKWFDRLQSYGMSSATFNSTTAQSINYQQGAVIPVSQAQQMQAQNQLNNAIFCAQPLCQWPVKATYPWANSNNVSVPKKSTGTANPNPNTGGASVI